MTECLSVFLEMHIEDAYRGEMIRVMYFNILHTDTQKKIGSKGRKVKLKILISRLISLALYHRILAVVDFSIAFSVAFNYY